MKKGYLLTLILSLLLAVATVFRGYPQGASPHFRDIFERETRALENDYSYGKFKNINGMLSFFPDTLPDWIFQPPSSNLSSVYAVGISDPDMIFEEALDQAFHRARLIAVMRHESRVEYFRDVYTSDREDVYQRGYRQRFDTFFRISAKQIASEDQFEILETHQTRYGEVLTLVCFYPERFSENSHPVQMQSLADLLYIEAQVGDAFEPQSSYELKGILQFPSDSLAGSQFMRIRKGNREESSSEYNGCIMDYPRYVYRYTSNLLPAYSMPFTSYEGLWAAYFSYYFQHIALTTEQSALRLRNLRQQTEPESTDLAREVSSFRGRFNLLTMNFEKGKMVFEIELTEP